MVGVAATHWWRKNQPIYTTRLVCRYYLCTVRVMLQFSLVFKHLCWIVLHKLVLYNYKAMAREFMLCLCITNRIINLQHKTKHQVNCEARLGHWMECGTTSQATSNWHLHSTWQCFGCSSLSVLSSDIIPTHVHTQLGMDGMYWGQEKALASLVTESGCQGGTDGNFTRYQQTIWLHPHMHPCIDLVSGICYNWFCCKQAVVWTTSRFGTLASLWAPHCCCMYCCHTGNTNG